jgi:hypothetical protein
MINLSKVLGQGFGDHSRLEQPRAGQTIRIRGFGSFSNSNDFALYVVDGIPMVIRINA